MSDARWLALHFLFEVDQGRHADQVTRTSLFEALTPADRGLAKELVFGCLRQKLLLDYSLVHHSQSALARLDLPILWILRLGAYQILFLRVPQHAAVHTSVQLCRRAGFRSASGFVNAVLRNLIRRPVPAPEGKEPAQLAIRFSHPEWLVRRYLQRWGAESSCRFMSQNNRPAEAVFWVNPRWGTPIEFLKRLEKMGFQGDLHLDLAQSVGLDPQAVAQATRWPECGFLMDEGSQRIIAGVRGEQGLFGDFCAAPGGKTFCLEGRLAGSAGLVVCDVNFKRLDQLRQRARTLGIQGLKLIQGDALEPPFRLASFDFLLLDVPCSGLGTIRSNPDIRWRIEESDLAGFQVRQRKILAAAVEHLKTGGGSLIYATCSTEPEENQAVVDSVLLEQNARISRESQSQNFPGQSRGDSFFWAQLVRHPVDQE